MGMAEYNQAQQDVNLYQNRVTSYQIKVLTIQNDLKIYQAAIDAGDPEAQPAILEKIKSKLAKAEASLAEANDDLAQARERLKTALDDNGQDTASTSDSQTGVPAASNVNTEAENEKREDAGESSTSATSGGATVLPAVVITAKRNKKDGPNPGKPNPLSKFSSWAYSVALYMVTPEAFNTFTETGEMSQLKGSGKGVYVIAQSGGINNKMEDRLITLDGTLGPGKEGLDYFIDDVTIKSILPGGKNQASLLTEVSFKIHEPMGFTFLRDVSRASRELNKTSPIMQSQPPDFEANGFTQHYIMGIKFYGYDINGKIITSGSPEVQGYENGGGDGDENAVLQRYFPLQISEMKFKLDGKMVTYDCAATIVGEKVAYGNMNGTITQNFTISGSTVEEILVGGSSRSSKGLAQVINNSIEDKADKKLTDLTYEIDFEFLDKNGKPDANSAIAKARLVDDTTFSNVTVAPDQSKSSDQVDISDSFGATSFDTTKSAVSVKSGQKITSVIDSIITKSKFITDALNTVKTQDIEAESISRTALKALEWYSVNPVVTAKGINKNKAWTYDIKFQIRPYDVYYIRTNYIDNTRIWPGPFKEYNYWFTGKNTEVISYVQEYNSLYYVTAAISTNAEDLPNRTGSAPVAHENTVAGDKGGPGLNKGAEINESVRGQLYSPSDQGIAKIKIMGDPDFLVTSSGVSQSTSVDKFQSIDGSINPFGGQVTIQMIFNMATDYSMKDGSPFNNGLLDVTDRLQFYQTTKARDAGIKGMVFAVQQVESTLSKGVFHQTLECIIVDEELLVTGESSGDEGRLENDEETQTGDAYVPGYEGNAGRGSANDPRRLDQQAQEP